VSKNKLKSTSDYAQNIVQTVREPLVVLDDKFRVISANRSFYSTFKVTPETSENTLLFDLGNGQWDIPRLRELLERVLPKSTTIEDFEVEHNFPAIGQKTMLINARRVQSETGSTQIILLAIEDITERKAYEETLSQSEDKYRTLFESARDALMTLAPPSWTFTSCNPAALEMFGAKDESEFTSLGSWDLSPDLQPDGMASADKAREMIEKALRDGSVLFEWTHRRLSGEEFPATVLLTRMEIGGEIVVKATVRDITERRRLEDKLRDASEYAQSIVNTVREPLVVLDGNLRVMSANRSFYSTFKVTSEMSENTLLFDLGDGQWNIPRLRELLEEVLPKSKTIEGFEVEHKFPVIGHKIMLMNARRIQSEAGATQMMLLAIDDITERRTAEEELKRVNAELEGYAHTVSHDLKGPLSVVSLAGQLSKELLNEPITEESHRELQMYAETLDANVIKCFNLIKDLLALAEAGQVPRDTKDVDVAEVVSRILEENAEPIREKKIIVKVGSDLGRVRANQTHVYQVFANLIGNAVNHCKSETPVIEVSYLGEEDGGHHYLVRDNGEGIPPQNLGKVFEPFFKGESGGTGIGLATVAKLIKLYGGEIRVYNDKGACFDFTIHDMAFTK
jgi:PAS domain S-box-containing protein